MFKIDGAIFDLDGTLMDSMWIWGNYGIKFFGGTDIIPGESLNEELRTFTLRQAAEHCIEKYNMNATSDQLMDKVNRSMENLYANEIKTKPGVHEFLRMLSARGVRMCVATATDYHLTKSVLASNKIDSLFSEIITCTDTGLSKNTPEIFEYALEKLGTPKASTFVFEDACHAVKTAKSAGFPVIGISDKWEAVNEKTIRAQADAFVKDFTELMELFA